MSQSTYFDPDHDPAKLKELGEAVKAAQPHLPLIDEVAAAAPAFARLSAAIEAFQPRQSRRTLKGHPVPNQGLTAGLRLISGGAT